MASRTIRRCTFNFFANPAIVPIPNSANSDQSVETVLALCIAAVADSEDFNFIFA